eukprot:12206572-Alexandrium_andersonii.AAC.1
MRGSRGQTEVHAVPRREYDRCEVYGSDAQCFVEMRGSHGWAQCNRDMGVTVRYSERDQHERIRHRAAH